MLDSLRYELRALLSQIGKIVPAISESIYAGKEGRAQSLERDVFSLLGNVSALIEDDGQEMDLGQWERVCAEIAHNPDPIDIVGGCICPFGYHVQCDAEAIVLLVNGVPYQETEEYRIEQFRLGWKTLQPEFVRGYVFNVGQVIVGHVHNKTDERLRLTISLLVHRLALKPR